MIRLIVILPLLLISLSCGTENQPESISSSQWELLNYLPANTEYLLYANLQKVRKTRFAEEKFISTLPGSEAGGWINKLRKATGTDLRKDIDEIAMADTRDDTGIIIVRFNNNYDKIKKYFTESSDIQMTGSDKIVVLSGKPEVKLYFTGQNLLIASASRNYLDSLVMNKGRRLRSNDNFISIIKNIKVKNNLWMATDKGAFAAGIFDRIAGKNSRLLSPEILSSIDDFSFCAVLSDGAEIESALGCSSAGNAYLIAAAVKGGIAMNILSQKNYRMSQIFKKLDVNREGKLVRFHLSLSENELDDIQQLTKLEKPGNNSKGKLW